MGSVSFHLLSFYFFAALLITAALAVVFSRNPVHAALALVMAFVSMAGVWLLLLAEFLAIVLVLVYVGAVLVLFLFVVMMLDINLDRAREGFIRYLPIGIAIVAVIGVHMWWILNSASFANQGKGTFIADENYSNTQELGIVLYRDYLYLLEIAGVLLLLAIVSAIALTFRVRSDRRTTNPAAQIEVEASQRLSITQMPSEPKATKDVNRDL